MLYYYCRNIPNGQPDFPNMLILQKLGGLTTPPIPPLATALIKYMILLSLHCRNSEALRCSVLQTGSVVYGSLSITSFESVINQSELCVQILDACLTHARKHHRDPCRLSFTQRACSQASNWAVLRVKLRASYSKV